MGRIGGSPVSATVLDARDAPCRPVARPATAEAVEAVRRVLARVRETGTCP